MDNNNNKPGLGDSSNNNDASSNNDGETINVSVGKSSQDIINEAEVKTPEQEVNTSNEDSSNPEVNGDESEPKNVEDDQSAEDVTITTTVTEEAVAAPAPIAPIEEKVTPKVQETPAGGQQSPNEATLKERNKHLKVWLVVLIVLLVAVASALVVYFFNQSKTNSNLDAANTKNSQLQQEIVTQQQSATQKTIDGLNAQITDQKIEITKLNDEITAQQKTIDELNTAIIELQKICGTACDSVNIPVVDTQSSAADEVQDENNATGNGTATQ